jgi:hypothetical protein
MRLNETISTPNAPSPVAFHGAASGAWHSMTTSPGPDVVVMAATKAPSGPSSRSGVNVMSDTPDREH